LYEKLDWSSWVFFVLKGIGCDEKKKEKETKKHERECSKTKGSGNGKKLL